MGKNDFRVSEKDCHFGWRPDFLHNPNSKFRVLDYLADAKLARDFVRNNVLFAFLGHFLLPDLRDANDLLRSSGP